MIQVLGMLDCDPVRTPGLFDKLQRELDEWFARGGSCRAFVERKGGVWRV
jgi:hypothetical protein